MKNTTLCFALAAAMLSLPVTALAQDEAAAEEASSPFSWNLALTSDYVYRGVSQSDEKPALQLGGDFSFGPGFYVGGWASNVDFGDGGPDFEYDAFVGWNTDLNDSFNLDLSVVRYMYSGASDDFGNINYNEFIAALAYSEAYTFTFGYTDDVYNLDADSFYYHLGGGWDIGRGFSLDAGYGLTTFASAAGFEDYQEWSLGVSRDIGMANVALRYHDTNGDGNVNFGDVADDRVVLTISVEG